MTAVAPLRLLLVDDEELARLRLRALLADLGPELPAQVAAEAPGAATALDWLRAHECDAVLLDIRMPGRDGLQLAAALKALPHPPAVVFVTAHAEHALQAFEIEAVDYLTKPVRLERLRAALQRVALRVASRSSPPAAPADDDVIVVNDRGRIVRVPVGEVLYLKAELKYVTLRTAAHSYILDDALADLEHRVGDRFVRVHRNALVARRAVRALERRTADGDDEGWAVRVAPVDEWLAVSRRQLAAVREALTQGGR